MIRTFPSGKRWCDVHNSSSCACLVTPSFPMEKDKCAVVRSKKFYGKSRLINGKERRVIVERFHSYRVKFAAKVAYDKIGAPEFFLRNNVKFKRLDFERSFVQIFSKSILIILRSSAEIKGLPIKEAKVKADEIIADTLKRLPLDVNIDSKSLSSLHNAFINHPLALRKTEVVIDGEKRFISDNSKGSPEFEAIHPKFVVSDSEAIEQDIIGLVDKGLSRDFLAKAINSLIEDRYFHAENMRSHVEAIKELGEGVRELRACVSSVSRADRVKKLKDEWW